MPRGRPKLPDGETMDVTLRLRCRPEVAERLQRAAEHAGADFSSWARVVLGAAADEELGRDAAGERLAGSDEAPP